MASWFAHSCCSSVAKFTIAMQILNSAAAEMEQHVPTYLQVCSVASGDVLVSFAHAGPTADLAFSPTEPQLASAAPGELALWSPDSHMVFKDAVGVVCCRILEASQHDKTVTKHESENSKEAR